MAPTSRTCDTGEVWLRRASAFSPTKWSRLPKCRGADVGWRAGGGPDRLHYCSGIPSLRSLITVLCSAASALPFVEHVQEYRQAQACQQMNQ